MQGFWCIFYNIKFFILQEIQACKAIGIAKINSTSTITATGITKYISPTVQTIHTVTETTYQMDTITNMSLQ